MSKTFIQEGDTITAIAPTGGLDSGDGVVIGSLFGIAVFDAAAGAEVELQTTGVHDLPKGTGAVAWGAKIYWDATNGVCTTTASGNRLIGAAILDAASGAASVRVRLDGKAI